MTEGTAQINQFIGSLPKPTLRAYEREIWARHPSIKFTGFLLGSLLITFGEAIVGWVAWALLTYSGSVHRDALTIVLGIGAFAFPIAAGVLLARGMNREYAHQYLRNLVARSRCVWCEYDLSAHRPPTANHIRCPECGKDSPVLNEPRP